MIYSFCIASIGTFEKSDKHMRRFRQEITDRKIIEEILSGSEICRLGFIDGQRAYVLPFNYGYHDNCIYIHCAHEGKKLDLLRKNNEVCFEIEHGVRMVKDSRACGWETTFRSVVGYGIVEIITDPGSKRFALDVLMKHNGAGNETDLDYPPEKIDLVTILKIRITEVTGKQSRNWPGED